MVTDNIHAWVLGLNSVSWPSPGGPAAQLVEGKNILAARCVMENLITDIGSDKKAARRRLLIRQQQSPLAMRPQADSQNTGSATQRANRALHFLRNLRDRGAGL